MKEIEIGEKIKNLHAILDKIFISTAKVNVSQNINRNGFVISF